MQGVRSGSLPFSLSAIMSPAEGSPGYAHKEPDADWRLRGSCTPAARPRNITTHEDYPRASDCLLACPCSSSHVHACYLCKRALDCRNYEPYTAVNSARRLTDSICPRLEFHPGRMEAGAVRNR